MFSRKYLTLIMRHYYSLSGDFEPPRHKARTERNSIDSKVESSEPLYTIRVSSDGSVDYIDASSQIV